MFKRIVLTGSLVLALALVIPAHADTIYSVVLLGSNEVPRLEVQQQELASSPSTVIC